MQSGQEAQQQAPSVFVSFVTIYHVSLYLVTATLPHYSVRNNQNEKLTSFTITMHTVAICQDFISNYWLNLLLFVT